MIISFRRREKSTCTICDQEIEGYSGKRVCGKTCAQALARREMEELGYRRTRRGWVDADGNLAPPKMPGRLGRAGRHSARRVDA
jgi:hypothetical protein